MCAKTAFFLLSISARHLTFLFLQMAAQTPYGGINIDLTAALQQASGVRSLTHSQLRTECAICKESWETLASNVLNMQWRFTKMCEHTACTGCYYRLVVDEAKTVNQTRCTSTYLKALHIRKKIKCPLCRQETNPHDEKMDNVPVKKFVLLNMMHECLNNINETARLDDLQKQIDALTEDLNKQKSSQLEDLTQIQQLTSSVDEQTVIINELKNGDAFAKLTDDNNKLNESLRIEREDKKILTEQVQILNDKMAVKDKLIANMNDKQKELRTALKTAQTVATEASKTAMQTSQTCSRRLAEAERQLQVMLTAGETQFMQINRTREQMLQCREQIFTRAFQEARTQDMNLSIALAMMTSLMDEINSPMQEFLPPILEEALTHYFQTDLENHLMNTAFTAYDDALKGLASMKVAASVIRDQCMKEELIATMTKHIKTHAPCMKQRKHLLDCMSRAKTAIDTMAGTCQLLNNLTRHDNIARHLEHTPICTTNIKDDLKAAQSSFITLQSTDRKKAIALLPEVEQQRSNVKKFAAALGGHHMSLSENLATQLVGILNTPTLPKRSKKRYHQKSTPPPTPPAPPTSAAAAPSESTTTGTSSSATITAEQAFPSSHMHLFPPPL